MGKGRALALEAELYRLARLASCDRVTFAQGWLRDPVPRGFAFGE